MADALLALSNTAAAVDERIPEDDDRSSSLSELGEAPDNVELEDDLSDEDEDEDETAEQELDPEADDEDDEEEPENIPVTTDDLQDGESEAETERLEESPDKAKKSAFQISPSKLAQTMNASDDVRPEIEELTDDASSPLEDPDSDIEDVEDADNPLNLLSAAATVTSKRKRLSDVMDITSDERPRKRRTESLSDIEDESEAESEVEKVEPATRESTLEPDGPPATQDQKEEDEEEAEVEPVAEASDDSKTKKAEQRTRSRSRRGKDPAEEAEENEPEASDDDVEPEELDATAKSEEDQLRRVSAMESLTALEKHFATLRDKMYDDKITQLNNELDQLSATGPTHTELLKQYECVNKFTEDKQEVEQRRLVYRVESLKKESVGRRSQIHSAYFQTIRDVRERHLENMAEHFYRIQRERFKSTKTTPLYTVPFPDKKLDRVTQQVAYNKEVSILSGVAKYVGFPAAPDLQPTPNTELDADLAKMGISSTSARIRSAAAATHRQSHPYTGATSALAQAAANTTTEQQFIESTPWANPNHPIHRLARSANSTPFDSYTPATRPHYEPISGSTIIDPLSSAIKHETNGDEELAEYSSRNVSPTERRRMVNSMLQAGEAAYAEEPTNSRARDLPDWMMPGSSHSSPLMARASLLSSLNRTASAMGRTKSPFRSDLVAGGGMGRFGFR